MIRFAWPAAWLLAIPAAALLWRLARGWGRATSAIRVAIVVLLIAALSGVQLRLGGRGSDLIVLVDRSASMSESDRRECDELIATLVGERDADGRGANRLAVVSFARDARLQQRLTAEGGYGGDVSRASPYGSDLAGGLGVALALLDHNRPGRILVLSDGEATGPSALPSARRAAAAGVPIDYRLFERASAADVAVGALLLPTAVDRNEPFQFSAVVHSDRAVEVDYALHRAGGEPVRGRRPLVLGANRWVFRDVLSGPAARGVVEYRLQVEPASPADDPRNNTARGVVHVRAPAAILLVNNTGRPDNLFRALTAAELNVDLLAAGSAELDIERLAGYRACILENVSASDLGASALRAVSAFVRDLGGGLLMSGGRRAFGPGGYHLSELDRADQPVLPVSMELRREHRKLSSALAIVMDRSGSMSIPVGGGRTKMDLANLAAAEAVALLSDIDSVTVIAVDSSAHVIVPLTSAAERAAIAAKVRSIQSMGGGIYVYTGLVAGGKQLERASQATHHLILFADAADAEEPGDYVRLLERFEKLGITVSVIALGRPTDDDADFLRDVARRGHGQIFFTEDPADLPRLFKQDTVAFAPDTFIREPTAVRPLLDLRTVGQFDGSPMPGVGGYNLTYLRPGAMLGYQTEDDYAAPVVAFWQRGLGRAMAATFEADGEHSGPLLGWSDYAGFLATVGRWLLGRAEPDGMRVSLERRGGRGVVRLELDPERTNPASLAPLAHVVGPGDEAGGERTMRLPLRWISDSAAEAEFDMDQTGTYQAAVSAGGASSGFGSGSGPGTEPASGLPSAAESDGPRVLRTGAVCLPYSPEFAPRVGLPSGREVLAAVAAVSGGQARLAVAGAFEPASPTRQWVGIRPALLWAALLLTVCEIAGRRLGLWNASALDWLGRALRRTGRFLPRGLGARFGRLVPRPTWFRRREPVPTPSTSEPAATAAPVPTAPEPSPPPSAPKPSAFDRAKRRARRDYRR